MPGRVVDRKVLVTGGTGHLGSNLVYHLVHDLGMDPGDIRVFFLEGTSTNGISDVPGLELVAGNILDRSSLDVALEDVELVFHLVGNTSFDPAVKRIQWLVNVEGTRNVIEAVVRSESAERLLHVSTVNVLGVPDPPGSIGDFDNSNPYTNKPRLHSFESPEETLSFANDVHDGKIKNWVKRIGIGYFDSKLAAQELVNHAVKERGVDAVSVLPGTMFGPRDTFIGAGMYILAVYHGMLPGLLPGGSPLVHVMDVVEGMMLAMENAPSGSMYILSGQEDDNRYLKDMVGIIGKVIKEKDPGWRGKVPDRVIPQWLAMLGAGIMELKARLSRQPCLLSRAEARLGSLPLFYTCKKARNELGYEPKRTFEQAVGEMFEYYRSTGLLAEKTRRTTR